MPHDVLGVAVAQFAPGTDTSANLQTIGRLTRTAVERGARLVVFPEYSAFFSAPIDETWLEAAEDLDGEFVTGLAAVAQDQGVHLVAGMIERAPDGRFFNTLVAVNPSGDVVAVYRKIHLYDAFGQKESEFVAPGPIEDPIVFDVQGVPVAMQTCYDIRFPEVSRRLAEAGAQLIALPAEWVRGPLKEYHWRTLVTARAIENTVYFAAADQAPPIGVGNSMIVDPMGIELATIGEIEDVAVSWVSRGRVRAVREVNPALALRRFDIVPRTR
ncbi:carbon-nitrogen hydrolase family protein [Ruicaihuangia caeni]|uniref:Carbon-nitrogen hydrolase family protein n=1 Tax=Ruicaihuangia caeni TaxID=3042517 RepID=A0AAW6T2K6_9MICO|nr:carbon-nitrogen hydrolase family protein [Klugiella sp. YN-L-19]MDI2097554.1 carbon-nitrogen hydrolase family protein [Klugiella sp. YN-L-19]